MNAAFDRHFLETKPKEQYGVIIHQWADVGLDLGGEDEYDFEKSELENQVESFNRRFWHFHPIEVPPQGTSTIFSLNGANMKSID